jgi:hypothetical protein
MRCLSGVILAALAWSCCSAPAFAEKRIALVVRVGTTCSGSSTSAAVVSSGRIIGQGVSGHVSPNGAASAVGNANGITVISSGHPSGRSGSGSFRQSDGCVGRWTATKN